MADYVKGIKTQNGTVLIDYESLANKPDQRFVDIETNLKTVEDKLKNVGTDVMNAVVPATRTINGKDLSADINLTAEDVKAMKVGGSLGDNVDFNTIIDAGCYRFEQGAINSPVTDWGQLLVIHGGNDTIAQIVFSHSSSVAWLRSGSGIDNNGHIKNWNNWAEFSIDAVKKAGDTMTGTLTIQNGSLYLTNPSDGSAISILQGANAVMQHTTQSGSMYRFEINADSKQCYLWDGTTINHIFHSGNLNPMPVTGGTFSGGVTFNNGIYLNSTCYGDVDINSIDASIPGRIFFKKV